jgi:hypothetical protein
MPFSPSVPDRPKPLISECAMTVPVTPVAILMTQKPEPVTRVFWTVTFGALIVKVPEMLRPSITVPAWVTVSDREARKAVPAGTPTLPLGNGPNTVGRVEGIGAAELVRLDVVGAGFVIVGAAPAGVGTDVLVLGKPAGVDALALFVGAAKLEVVAPAVGRCTEGHPCESDECPQTCQPCEPRCSGNPSATCTLTTVEATHAMPNVAIAIALVDIRECRCNALRLKGTRFCSLSVLPARGFRIVLIDRFRTFSEMLWLDKTWSAAEVP